MALCATILFSTTNRWTIARSMIRTFFNRLVAILFICFISLTSSVFFIVALITWLLTSRFDRQSHWLHQLTCLWASLYIWAFPLWSVKIRHRNRIDRNKTYVIVANHRSLLDILAVFTLFVQFKWVSKSEQFKIPLIGWNMALNRYVRLRRGGQGNRNNIKKMYRACEKHLKRGSSVFVFPEGSPNNSREPATFREGAFVLAKRRDVPILPLVISGSEDSIENGRLTFLKRVHINITVLDEIPPESFTNVTSKALATEVRQMISSELTRSDL
jgi:1-acyl-sn-glycerol-3-phosphate acyltransferase